MQCRGGRVLDVLAREPSDSALPDGVFPESVGGRVHGVWPGEGVRSRCAGWVAHNALC
jgi:hypothetical protein